MGKSRKICFLSALFIVMLPHISINEALSNQALPEVAMSSRPIFEIVVPLSNAIQSGDKLQLEKLLTKKALDTLQKRVGKSFVSGSLKKSGRVIGFITSEVVNSEQKSIIKCLTRHPAGVVRWEITIDNSRNRITKLDFAALGEIEVQRSGRVPVDQSPDDSTRSAIRRPDALATPSAIPEVRPTASGVRVPPIQTKPASADVDNELNAEDGIATEAHDPQGGYGSRGHDSVKEGGGGDGGTGFARGQGGSGGGGRSSISIRGGGSIIIRGSGRGNGGNGGSAGSAGGQGGGGGGGNARVEARPPTPVGDSALSRDTASGAFGGVIGGVVGSAISGRVVSSSTGLAGGDTPKLRPEGLKNVTAAADSETKSVRQLQVLFATTRKIDSYSSGAFKFNAERANETTFGTALVNIPARHNIGEIERPTNWSFYGFNLLPASEDDQIHFTVKRTEIKSRDDFVTLIRGMGRKEALIFVHGYNNTFDDSLFRVAQIVWDLQYDGLPVLFSWPSRGTTTGYFYDRDSAYGSRAAFIDLIEILRRQSGIEKINVLAHSMGNLLVMDSLSSYAKTADPVHISKLIMAAPDVDRDQFMQFVPSIAAISSGMTLYASSQDKALVASKEIAQVPRAGDVVLGSPITLPNLESIDVSILGDEMFGLNHNIFSTKKSVLNDIKLLLNNVPPPRLIDIRGAPDGFRPPTFWRYVP